MTSTPNEALAALRQLVEQAKGVPMTSHVRVAKSEVLALLDQADAAVTADAAPPADAGAGGEAESIRAEARAESERVIADARREAERIVADAREEAAVLAGKSEVAQAAKAEAEALRLESHTWVDNHLAEFETGLQRTLEQVETLRDRLAARSRDDDAG